MARAAVAQATALPPLTDITGLAPPAGAARTTRLLLRRAHVWSPSRPDATAVLLEGARIAWIGDEDGVAGLYALGSLSGVTELDCAGGLITPAFVDAHVHLFATGLTLPGADGTVALAGVSSATELLAAVATAAATLPSGTPVLGFGWDEGSWPTADLPDAAALRRAAGGREVFLGRVDMHSALVAAAGVAPSGPDGGGALQSWEGTGPGGSAFARLSADPPLRRRVIGSALAQAAAEGIGCVHEMAAPHLNPVSDLDLLAAFDADPGQPRVLRWWGEHVDSGGVARAQAAGAVGCGGDLCVDGSIGSRTAALHAPYADATGHRGQLQLDPPSIARHVRACVEARIGTGFHVIGDAAAAAVAEGLTDAARTFGGRLPVPVRIEHAELIEDHVLPVLASLGVLAGVQPGFQTRWGGPDGLYERRLGSGRAARMNRFAGLAAAGIPLALGSDSPVLPLSGWAMVRDAAFHPDPAQRLTVRAAFAAATRGGWRAAGAPDRGVLVPGAVADLALWETSGSFGIQTPDPRVAAWSTDPRARVPALPVLDPDLALPSCRLLLVGGAVVFDAA